MGRIERHTCRLFAFSDVRLNSICLGNKAVCSVNSTPPGSSSVGVMGTESAATPVVRRRQVPTTASSHELLRVVMSWTLRAGRSAQDRHRSRGRIGAMWRSNIGVNSLMLGSCPTFVFWYSKTTRYGREGEMNDRTSMHTTGKGWS